MREQEQNRSNEESGSAREFSMPDCCGPMVNRMRGADTKEKGPNGRSVCEGMMSKMTAGENPMESCPMSAIFKRSSGKRGFGLLAIIPGLLLVLVGVAIMFEPQILVWLLAATSIVLGLLLLAAALFVRRLATGIRGSAG
jgi:hypothetical protein